MKTKTKKKIHEFKAGPKGGKGSSTTGIPWAVCTRCGLVNLNNKATKQAISDGCNAYDD